MTVCLFDTLAVFLSYGRAVVDPVICPVPYVEDRWVPVYITCLKLIDCTLPTQLIYIFLIIPTTDSDCFTKLPSAVGA